MFQTLSSSLSKWRTVAASCLLAGVASVAQAGFVTTNEVGMDAIFSQASFGGNTIDIRFNATQTIHNSALLIIDGANDSELFQLDTIAGAGPTVAMFFVDSIAFCGGPTNTTVGCAFVNNNTIALNSSFAANATFGANLAGHELGHALGLGHFDDPSNLMNPILSGSSSSLLAAQVNLIGFSNLIQIDARTGERFIAITPYEVLADLVNTVPEPGTLLLVAMALGAAASSRRKDRSTQQD